MQAQIDASLLDMLSRQMVAAVPHPLLV